MVTELLHMELRQNLDSLDQDYVQGIITAAEYLSASAMIEERIDFLIQEEMDTKELRERYDS